MKKKRKYWGLRFRICKYKGSRGVGYSLQWRSWHTFWLWLNVKNIYGELIVRSTKEEIRSIIKNNIHQEKITPTKEIW